MNNPPLWQTHAHGKLLLTGEYAVLDGALALAVPARFGQSLRVDAGEKPGQLSWVSRDMHGAVWFRASFSLPELTLLRTSNPTTSQVLQEVLLACRRQNPQFPGDTAGLNVTTQTEFPHNWGLGTSSTLVAALAQWANVDPYAVLAGSFGGSGYDIACAFADGPLLFRLTDEGPSVQRVPFSPPFADRLFFVFLGKKQNSRDAIRHYRGYAKDNAGLPGAISQLTRQCLEAQTLADFSAILLEHERLTGAAIGLPRAQELYFPDFPGVVKSLGAWGGDFVLAAAKGSPAETRAYFAEKGFEVCVPYREMVW